MSHNADHPRPNYEHTDQANSPPVQPKKSIAWNEVKEELFFLEDLLKLKDKTPEDLQEASSWVLPP